MKNSQTIINQTEATNQAAAAINKAAGILKAGGLVAFPTETVYGLGADAANDAACLKVFAVKGRPHTHPLIIHIASMDALSSFAREIPPIALQLAQAFWPGPLTLIFKKQKHVSDIVTGGQDTVALRVPNHPIAQSLLQAFGGAIAAPSANKFTYISATNAEAVACELGNEVDYILDGGASTLGLESTIIDVTSDTPRILRPGMISTTMLAQLDTPILLSRKARSVPGSAEIQLMNPLAIATIRAPGMHHLHYAPRTQTSLIETSAIPNLLQSLKDKPSDSRLTLPIALMTHTFTQKEFNNHHLTNIHVVTMPHDPIDYAHRLYRELRKLDHLNYQRIIIETVPTDAAWDAIQDRLLKATR